MVDSEDPILAKGATLGRVGERSLGVGRDLAGPS